MIKLRKVSSLVTGVGLIALVSVFQNCDRNIDCDRAGLAQSLNQKNYDEIISQEAELLTKCPDDRGVQITIAHAYLGSAGFEMFNMASISLRATDLLISLKNLDSSVLSDPPRVKMLISELQAVAPKMNEAQRANLNIGTRKLELLYGNAGSASDQNNFEIGAVYSYRALDQLMRFVLHSISIYSEGSELLSTKHQLLLHFGKFGTEPFNILQSVVNLIERFAHSYTEVGGPDALALNEQIKRLNIKWLEAIRTVDLEREGPAFLVELLKSLNVTVLPSPTLSDQTVVSSKFDPGKSPPLVPLADDLVQIALGQEVLKTFALLVAKEDDKKVLYLLLANVFSGKLSYENFSKLLLELTAAQ